MQWYRNGWIEDKTTTWSLGPYFRKWKQLVGALFVASPVALAYFDGCFEGPLSSAIDSSKALCSVVKYPSGSTYTYQWQVK